jgi:glyoxylase-like metal-dependent hydrolase (beta-lactamase superfamily II)
MQAIRLHSINTGRLVGNQTFLRGEGWSSLLRRPLDVGFPVLSFVLEHPGGLIAVDTGVSPYVRSPRPRSQRRFVPNPVERRPIGQAMRAIGFDPADVERVVLTHLDWDHAGGLADFPTAQVLVHRPEWEFAKTRFGRKRFEPELWPAGFSPSLYELDPKPFGPFPASLPLTPDGDVRIVPLPGHTPGHVGVVVDLKDARVLLCGDHVLRADWFAEDVDAGRLLGLGIWNAKAARDTSRRIQKFLTAEEALLIPSHDEESPRRALLAKPDQLPRKPELIR